VTSLFIYLFFFKERRERKNYTAKIYSLKKTFLGKKESLHSPSLSYFDNNNNKKKKKELGEPK
jgi:hypothetical protein